MAILFAISILMSFIIFPSILRIAKLKGLMDNPNARKLQKQPVPVIGGIAVFFSIVVSLSIFKTNFGDVNLFSSVCAMMIMLYLGTIDDILDISARQKFIVEIVVCILVIYGTHNVMMTANGLFGIDRLPLVWAIVVSVIGMVGIINAINLIDGVDGLSSGMSIFIFGVFAIFLFLAHEYTYCALATICAGALVPFFFFNVFGKEKKMFIGDGGALMIGIAISAIVLDILKGRGLEYYGFITDPSRFSLASFCLATLSVPVFDTLRVMITRISHGTSPFHADRIHLHHYLLNSGLSHIQTTITEICLNAMVLALWFVSYATGADANIQLTTVFLSGIIFLLITIRLSERRTRSQKRPQHQD